MSNKLASNPKNKVVIGSIIVQKKRILAGLVPELEAGNQFQWQKIGYNQVKHRWMKQGLDRIHHCAKRQDPMWFDSEMRVRKPECVKRTNKWTHEWTNMWLWEKQSPTPALSAGTGTNEDFILNSKKVFESI